MFKIHHRFSQVSFLNLLHNYYENNFYSLWSQPDFPIPRINTTLNGTEPVQNFGPIIWNNIPIEIRSIKHFDTFRTDGNRQTVDVDYVKLI